MVEQEVIPPKEFDRRAITYLVDLKDSGDYVIIPNSQTVTFTEFVKGKPKQKKKVVSKVMPVFNVDSSKNFRCMSGNDKFILGTDTSKFSNTMYTTFEAFDSIKESNPAIKALFNFYNKEFNKMIAYGEEVRKKFPKYTNAVVNKTVSDRILKELKERDDFNSNNKNTYIFTYRGLPITEYEDVKECWIKFFNDLDRRTDLSEELCLVTGEITKCPNRYLKIQGSNMFALNTPDSNSVLAYYNSSNRDVNGFYAPISEEANVKITKVFRYVLSQSARFIIAQSDLHLIMWNQNSEVFATNICPLNENWTKNIYEYAKAFSENNQVQIDSATIDKDDDLWMVLVDVPGKGRMGFKQYWHNKVGDFIERMKNQLDFFKFNYGYKKQYEFCPTNLGQIIRLLDEEGQIYTKQGLIQRVLEVCMKGEKLPEEFVDDVSYKINKELLKAKSISKIYNTKYLASLSLIKAYLTRDEGRDIDMNLYMVNPDNAYLFGVFFRACVTIQKTANDNIEPSTGFRKKYAEFCLKDPEFAFSNLHSDVQYYISKLLGTKPALAASQDRFIKELVQKMIANANEKGTKKLFPDFWSTSDRCSFAIGFEDDSIYKSSKTEIKIDDEDINSEEEIKASAIRQE